MQPAHVHLLLNHWPIIGSFIALGLFFISIVLNNDDLKQTGLVVFSLLALLSLPVYVSGQAAQEALKDSPDLSMDLIQSHQGAAFLALTFMEITGAAALLGLWRFSRSGKTSRPRRPREWDLIAVLLLSIVTVALMAIAGNTGGEIRHSEILDGPPVASAAAAVGSRMIQFIQYLVIDFSYWTWPILESLHYIGLTLLLGTVGVLSLRILGFLKQLPLAPLHRFIPWGMAGFAINIVSGMFFFVCMPGFYVVNYVFQLKLLAIMVAGATLLLFYFTSAFRVWAPLGPEEDAPPLAKLIAASQIILWIAIIVLGRYIPIGEVP